MCWTCSPISGGRRRAAAGYMEVWTCTCRRRDTTCSSAWSSPRSSPVCLARRAGPARCGPSPPRRSRERRDLGRLSSAWKGCARRSTVEWEAEGVLSDRRLAVAARLDFAIVVDRQPQPRFEVRVRRVADRRTDPLDGGARVAHLAHPPGRVPRREAYPRKVLDPLPQLSDADGFAAADVEHLAYNALSRRLARQQVGAHDVGDVDEVPRLPAVAADHRRLAAQRGEDEPRDDRCVRRRRVLARTENVEVAQRHGLKAVGGGKRPAILQR